MNLLITAFEPFGGRSSNTSADLLKALQKTGQKAPRAIFSYEVLPVNFYHAWPHLKAALKMHQPDAIILMGEKKGGQITLETTAHNRRLSRKGIIGIHKNAPAKIKAALAIPRLKSIAVSRNAGSYLCNFVYFKTLHHKPALPCLFVHIPALNQTKWLACQKSYTSIMQKVIAQVAKAIDGTKANVTTRENKKGAYHG